MASKGKKEQRRGTIKPDGELGDSDLDKVSGGQGPVQTMEPIVVTAKRLTGKATPVQHMEPIVVTARRPSPLEGTQVASANTNKKKT
jgi:hypothetical protein